MIRPSTNVGGIVPQQYAHLHIGSTCLRECHSTWLLHRIVFTTPIAPRRKQGSMRGYKRYAEYTTELVKIPVCERHEPCCSLSALLAGPAIADPVIALMFLAAEVHRWARVDARDVTAGQHGVSPPRQPDCRKRGREGGKWLRGAPRSLQFGVCSCVGRPEHAGLGGVILNPCEPCRVW